MLAVKTNREKSVELLLGAGADPNKVDKLDQEALDYQQGEVNKNIYTMISHAKQIFEPTQENQIAQIPLERNPSEPQEQ